VGRELQRAYGQESQVALTTPILEGLDGVQKMSKSLGNAIGIHEPPLEMYGKVMSISDEMMWRYYELLTDVQVAEIEKMKREVHPMQAKKELARRIVADFHSGEAAAKAGEDWGKQFQKNAAPENLDQAQVSIAQIRIADASPDSVEGGGAQIVTSDVSNAEVLRADKLVREAGLAASTAEAGRKIKEGAVHINGKVIVGLAILVSPREPLLVRVGKKIKRVVLTLP
jgi:tyrosyl-tRNA synthetase